MKKLFILSCLMIASFSLNAQTTFKELNSGKYFQNTSIKKFVGNWIATVDGNKIAVNISKQRKRIKSGVLNFETDVLLFKINQYNYEGQDISKFIIDPITIIENKDRAVYSGTFNDIIKSQIDGDTTKTNFVNMKITLISKNVVKWETTPYYKLPGTSFLPAILLNRVKED